MYYPTLFSLPLLTHTPIDAYCPWLEASGAWSVTDPSGSPLGAGRVSGPFSSLDAHRLGLGAAGPSHTASLNGTTLFEYPAASVNAGNLALGMGYHSSFWDNLEVSAL
jgi:hypothetical protein